MRYFGGAIGHRQAHGTAPRAPPPSGGPQTSPADPDIDDEDTEDPADANIPPDDLAEPSVDVEGSNVDEADGSGEEQDEELDYGYIRSDEEDDDEEAEGQVLEDHRQEVGEDGEDDEYEGFAPL